LKAHFGTSRQVPLRTSRQVLLVVELLLWRSPVYVALRTSRQVLLVVELLPWRSLVYVALRTSASGTACSWVASAV